MPDKVFVTPKEKLAEAVRLFRISANLHKHSPLSALVEHAHGSGKKKPGAGMVRDADHDYQHWRRRMSEAGQDPDAPTSSARPFDPADVPEDPRPDETARKTVVNQGEEDRHEERGPASEEATPSRGRRATKSKPPPTDDEEILY